VFRDDLEHQYNERWSALKGSGVSAVTRVATRLSSPKSSDAAKLAKNYLAIAANPVHTSGKLVILGIVGVALVGAGASWWYRYEATHRAAEFWGPQAARLIRDAPQVTLQRRQFEPGEIDISKAQGITHLRNALLENRSYDWPQPETSVRPQVSMPRWVLIFSDPSTNENVAIQFSDDCGLAQLLGESKRGWAISCAPIKAGLSQVFSEYSTAKQVPSR
jgi:hypothetical protein